MRLGCILLAAGSGRRFDGDKLAYPVCGVSMLEHALALHAAIPYASRVLVARPGDTFVHACAEKFHFTLAVNSQAARGVGTSVAVGLAALMAACDAPNGALFGVCDQPYLSEETVRALLLRFRSEPDAIVAPCADEKRGNPVIFPRALFAELLALDGDVGGSAVLARHAELVRLVPAARAQELVDIDTRAAAGMPGF